MQNAEELYKSFSDWQGWLLWLLHWKGMKLDSWGNVQDKPRAAKSLWICAISSARILPLHIIEIDLLLPYCLEGEGLRCFLSLFLKLSPKFHVSAHQINWNLKRKFSLLLVRSLFLVFLADCLSSELLLLFLPSFFNHCRKRKIFRFYKPLHASSWRAEYLMLWQLQLKGSN